MSICSIIGPREASMEYRSKVLDGLAKEPAAQKPVANTGLDGFWWRLLIGITLGVVLAGLLIRAGAHLHF
ncbi:MAG: hypothetical protein V1856_02955 [Candidatus Liptonbacteria bacterium]